MRKLIISMALMLSVLFCCDAQDFSSILSDVERNNATLKALRSKAEADKLDARTGLTPDDPEVEIGYLWETKDSQGSNRFDLGVSQTFDFPTVYYWRKKISDGQCTVAEIEYAIGRKQILAQARQQCVELVYGNAICEILLECMDNSRKVFEGMERRYRSGDIGVVALNEARLSLMSATRAYERAEMERRSTLDALTLLNGGVKANLECSDFAPVLVPESFESWFASASATNSEIELSSKGVEIAESSIKLAQSEWLPKFSIGYTSESIAGSSLQGISGGLSIPLWSGKGRVKAARARRQASADMLEAERTRYMSEMKARYDKLVSLSEMCEEHRALLADSDAADLLIRSLHDGEINFEQYSMSMQLWYSSRMELLESYRDCHLLLVELEDFAR